MKNKKKFAKPLNNSKEQAPQATKVLEAPVRIDNDTTAVMTIKLPGAVKCLYTNPDGKLCISYYECTEQRTINNATLKAWSEDGAKPYNFQGDWKRTGKAARCRANAAVEGGTLEFIN